MAADEPNPVDARTTLAPLPNHRNVGERWWQELWRRHTHITTPLRARGLPCDIECLRSGAATEHAAGASRARRVRVAPRRAAGGGNSGPLRPGGPQLARSGVCLMPSTTARLVTALMYRTVPVLISRSSAFGFWPSVT